MTDNAKPQDETQIHEAQLRESTERSDEHGEIDSPAEHLATLEAEREAAIDGWKRTQADLENFRKRAAREREDVVRHANERLVKELLPVLDDLERALAAGEEHAIEEGVVLVHRSLASLLERHGVKEIETAGAFDPHVHEALLSQPSEAEEGSVIDVVQKGYTLGDRVVRPARVVVAAPLREPDAGDG
jgi:molecular chaperone GrpE